MRSSRIRAAAGLLVTAVCWLGMSTESWATPLTYGDAIVKPLTWPKDSTLNVYIQKDPKDKGRDQLAKEGVERWKQTLADRKITLNVIIGNPPAGTENEIFYAWGNENFKFADGELELGVNDGMGFVGYSKTRLLVGKAFLHNDLPTDAEADKIYIRNLAEHEMTHVLGLADDEKGEITHHGQGKMPRAINDQDKKEINLLYGTADTKGDAKPQGKATKVGGGAGLGFYKYHFAFEPGNPVFNPADPEHVSLINFGIDPHLITGVDLPPGWIGLIPVVQPGQGDEFFLEYMEDGSGFPSVWDPSNPMTFIAFRVSFEEAFKDGLPSDFDPALTLDNISFDITLHTIPDVSEKLIRVWAGDELQWVLGPAPIPEPATWILLAGGFAAGCRLRRRNG